MRSGHIQIVGRAVEVIHDPMPGVGWDERTLTLRQRGRLRGIRALQEFEVERSCEGNYELLTIAR